MLLWIGARLPGLNELLNSKGTVRGQWNGYNEQKCMWYGRMKLLCLAKGIGLQGPGFLTMLYVEPNRKRDPDNIVGGGTKLLLDSLVGAGVLRGDGWGDNLGFIGYWVHRSNREGCLIHWGDEILTRDAMLALLEKELENAVGTSGAGKVEKGQSTKSHPERSSKVGRAQKGIRSRARR